MKIYQLHECGGEYEYYYNRVIGYYLKLERAEEEKFKAEIKENMRKEYSEKCKRCLFVNHPPFDNISDLLAKYPDYCTEAKLTKTNYGTIDCENFYLVYGINGCRYYVEEVEVEE